MIPPFQLAKDNNATVRYSCHPNAGDTDPETGKKTQFIEETATLFTDVNNALVANNAGGVEWHSIIPYPEIPDGVILPTDEVTSLSQKLEQANLVSNLATKLFCSAQNRMQ